MSALNPKEIKIMTEALIVKDGQILLGRKKRGFAQGKWLGFGGKCKPDEALNEAMKREFFEETSVKVLNFIKRGELTFHYINDPDMEVTYYEILDYHGEPEESEEIENKWFDLKDIPYDQMFPNDRYWLPMFLDKKYFTGEFSFDENYQINEYSIEEKIA